MTSGVASEQSVLASTASSYSLLLALRKIPARLLLQEPRGCEFAAMPNCNIPDALRDRERHKEWMNHDVLDSPEYTFLWAARLLCQTSGTSSFGRIGKGSLLRFNSGVPSQLASKSPADAQSHSTVLNAEEIWQLAGHLLANILRKDLIVDCHTVHPKLQ